MSRLYNYFLNGWKFNRNFTEQTLTNAVNKGYIKAEEKADIMATPREL